MEKILKKTKNKLPSNKAEPDEHALTQEQRTLLEVMVVRERGVYQIELYKDASGGRTARRITKESDSDVSETIELIQTMGTKSIQAATLIMGQLCDVATPVGEDLTQANKVLSLVHNLDPRDDLEAMLVAQLVTAHMLAMSCSSKAVHPENSLESKKLNLNYSNRLMRTFALQMAALDKHRGRGQQKMTVEHVHVGEGGQAIIGNVDSSGKAMLDGGVTG
jgi:hypothetical protein